MNERKNKVEPQITCRVKYKTMKLSMTTTKKGEHRVREGKRE